MLRPVPPLPFRFSFLILIRTYLIVQLGRRASGKPLSKFGFDHRLIFIALQLYEFE